MSKYFLARSIRGQEDYARAAAIYGEYLAEKPSEKMVPIAAYDLGECCERAGENEKAVKAYQLSEASARKADDQVGREFQTKAGARLAALGAAPMPELATKGATEPGKDKPKKGFFGKIRFW
jgi:predicted TPR repeat methyltransferase